MKYLLTILFALTCLMANAQFNSTIDSYSTSNGELEIHPINHGTVAFKHADKTIFVDPYGGAARFSSFDTPDIIFITDIHGDHLNQETLNGLDTKNTTFVVPQAVANQLEGISADQITIISNGETITLMNLEITAIPMYNLPDDETSRHKKGRGNGYLINFGDKTVYLSGDTEDIPEMRVLKNIDIAFVCMNLPYTMDIYQAASAVIDFAPKNMYPYHHRGQDIAKFKEIVTDANKNINVVLKDWYPKN